MKVYSLVVISIVFLFTTMCSREQIQSDIYVEKAYSFSGVKKIALSSIQARASIPFLKENFKDQLEFHFLQRGYEIVGLPGSSDNAAEKSFDLLVEASLYEELDEDLKGMSYHKNYGKNYIVVQLGFYDTTNKKVAVIRYIYKGRDSLASGNFMDKVLNEIFTKIESG